MHADSAAGQVFVQFDIPEANSDDAAGNVWECIALGRASEDATATVLVAERRRPQRTHEDDGDDGNDGATEDDKGASGSALIASNNTRSVCAVFWAGYKPADLLDVDEWPEEEGEEAD